MLPQHQQTQHFFYGEPYIQPQAGRKLPKFDMILC